VLKRADSFFLSFFVYIAALILTCVAAAPVYGSPSGTLLWKYETGYSLAVSPNSDADSVFIGSWDDSFYCIDARYGRQKWKITNNSYWSYIYSTAVFDDEQVFVAGHNRHVPSRNSLFCLDKQSGRVIWKASLGSGGSMTRRGVPSPALYDGRLYIGSAGGGSLQCLNVETGREIWRIDTEAMRINPPAVTDEVVVFAESDRIICIDRENAAQRWEFKLDTGSAGPVVADGKVFAGGRDDRLYCLEASTGRKIWSYYAGGDVESSPVAAEGHVYFSVDNGNFYCVEAESGRKKWHYHADSTVRSSPAVADGKVFFSSHNGTLYCMDAAAGRRVWSAEMEGQNRSDSDPRLGVVVADGRVYATYGQNVYCFDTGERDIYGWNSLVRPDTFRGFPVAAIENNPMAGEYLALLEQYGRETTRLFRNVPYEVYSKFDERFFQIAASDIETSANIVSRYGVDGVDFIRSYGRTGVSEYRERDPSRYAGRIAAAASDEHPILETGEPDLPPFPAAELEFDGTFGYLSAKYGGDKVLVKVRNQGKGPVFRLIGTLMTDDLDLEEPFLFYGRLDPGQVSLQTGKLSGLTPADIGKEITLKAVFSELNGNTPPHVEGRVRIHNDINSFVFNSIDRVPLDEIDQLVEQGLLSPDVAARAVLYNASELDPQFIVDIAGKKLIGSEVIDKIIATGKRDFSISQIKRLSSLKAVSERIVEVLVTTGKVSFSPDDLVYLGQLRYLSKEAVEAVFLQGSADFDRAQIRRLMELGLFTPPELLYTYRINDGSSETSVGNQDGVVQIGEGPDLILTLKNNSIFELERLDIHVVSEHPDVAMYQNTHRIEKLAPGETINVPSTFQIKRSFTDQRCSFTVRVGNDRFGELLEQEIFLEAGEPVARNILVLNRKVVANEELAVLSGARKSTLPVVTVAEGAVLEAVGELDDFYKVEIFRGQYGWVEKTMVKDYVLEQREQYIESAKLWDTGENEYVQAVFENSRPEVFIKSPDQRSTINGFSTRLVIEARDQTVGLSSILVRVNGQTLPGSTERGVRVTARETDRLVRTFEVGLQKGENLIEVTAFNRNMVASETEKLTVNSTGARIQPDLWLLSIGVSTYADDRYNLEFADQDAERMLRIFESQSDKGLYGEVHTKLLVNEEVSSTAVKESFISFLRQAKHHDIVIVFFAGHGVTDPSSGQYYFATHQTDLENPLVHGLSKDEIDNLIYSIPVPKTLVLFDTCRSGRVASTRGTGRAMEEVIDELSNSSGIFILSASSGREAAYEDPEWGNGAFTKAVDEGLMMGKADLNGNGYIGVLELQMYVSDRVKDLTERRQTPSFKYDQEAQNFDFFAR